MLVEKQVKLLKTVSLYPSYLKKINVSRSARPVLQLLV